MDESLTDFKDKKPATKGPKSLQKPAISKPKKSIAKRIKGQKDIRKALKGKQNELISYTKEFDDVCKQSGLDVETEQLLLAVALSKSLQKTEDTTDDKSPCTSLSSQVRTNKIRTTLQEYGFTVPDIKISKKSKVCKKNYKLLLSTQSEKQQTISDKYAQVLFDVCEHKLIDGKQSDFSSENLYYKATHIAYKDIRDNDVFYVDHLVEKSFSTGSLLRNWSDIPGRPSSPVQLDKSIMDFSEIECSQDELDIILSGSLRSSKNITKNKTRTRSVSAPVTIVVDNIECNQEMFNQFSVRKCSQTFNSEAILPYHISTVHTINKTKISDKNTYNRFSRSSDTEKNSLTTRNMTRSCSPDIFEDEESGILDKDEENKDIIYTQVIDSIVEDKNKTIQSIDLTQNSDVGLHNSLKCSQDNNFKKRNSNDVMEITECVGMSAVSKINETKSLIDQNSQGINLPNVTNSLSQQSQASNKTKRISNDFMEITDCVANKSILPEHIPVTTNVDLTQESDEDCEITVKTTILNKSHTSNSDEEVPIEIKTSDNESLDATIILNEDEIDSALRHSPILGRKLNENGIDFKETLDIDIDNSNNKPNELLSSESVFEEFKHDHSDDTVENVEKTASVELEACNQDENNIDLTQSSDDASEQLLVKETNTALKLDLSNLGKKDEVSIDYDDFLQKSKEDTLNASKLSHQSKESPINDDDISNSKSSKTSNQNSIVFELNDQELNYSINKSRTCIAWDNFGGISVMEDLSKLDNNSKNIDNDSRLKSKSDSSLRKSMSDSFLPLVHVSGASSKENDLKPMPNSTPINNKTKASVRTPVSSEYTIKTDQVTPMLDYASMSTPERNRELDKYGLKPFKRKRAVQILTHLYNQTHPLVESSEDIVSPSKRRKYNQPSPEKGSKSPKENRILGNKENNLYNVTKEVPDITNIECLEEDWVFQKREKAKLHACRVPLHIAFHNYVSCRRLLREAILRYEPVDIDEIHKGLVSIGFRYDPKELLKYMDKKCITVKTADNNGRNNKR